MSERGKGLLLAIAAKPKGSVAKEGGGPPDDDADAGGYEVNEGMRAAAQEIAALLGVPDDKADALAEALRDFVENC